MGFENIKMYGPGDTALLFSSLTPLHSCSASLKGIKILKTAGKSHRNITAVNVFGIDQSVMLADGSTVAKFDGTRTILHQQQRNN